MSNMIEFTNEQKEVIRKQFFPPNATKEDMQYCMGVAYSMGLNPITKEIYFVPRRAQVNGQWVEKIEPMLGRDSYIKLAHSTGKFGGMETTSSVETVPSLKDGKWVEDTDLVATCKVWRKDTSIPFVVNVRYSEYVQTTKSGEPTNFWKTKPDTMLKKVAESQALRKAFSIFGAIGEDEVEQIRDEYETKVITQPEPQQPPTQSTIENI